MSETRTANAFALAGVMFFLGLIGIVSTLSMPVPVAKPEGLNVSDETFKILLLLNPTILLLVAAAVGTPAARAVGLRAPAIEAMLTRGSIGAALRPMLKPAAIVAIATATVLLGYGAMTSAMELIPEGAAEAAAPSLAVRLLYGGMTEEVLLRWGAMSLFAWLFTRVKMTDAAFWLANLAAALLFAAGHLPFLFNVVPDASPVLVAAVLVGNAIPGLLFGWLFWRKGIEAAMLAHAGGHFLAWSAGLLLA